MTEFQSPSGWADVARRSDVELLRADLKLELGHLEARLVAMNVAAALATGGLVLAALKLV